MGFLDIFRRPTSIRTRVELADFIDQNAAFLVQKGIYEYARARAGVYAKILFTEAAFLELIEECRWRAYPLGLAMIGEMVEGVLRPDADNRQTALNEVSPMVLEVFDRYPRPARLSATEWSAAREQLIYRLQLISLHPPKLAKDIPEPYAEGYFALMPIHEKLRAMDYSSVRAYLKVSLCNIHDVFVGRLDARAVTEALNLRRI